MQRFEAWPTTMTTNHDNEGADAVRYAMLRRLAPGIRHGLMGDLQAIQFLAELAARQLRVSADVAKVEESLTQIIAHTRSNVVSCRSIVDWLRPEGGATIALGEGVAQCLKLAGDDWALRGVEASTSLLATEALVDKAALRELLIASLLALTDTHPGSLDIDVRSAVDGNDVELDVEARVADRRASMPLSQHERKLAWADVNILAQVHGVPCACRPTGATLRLRRIPAADRER
jgi:hypothetical protein